MSLIDKLKKSLNAKPKNSNSIMKIAPVVFGIAMSSITPAHADTFYNDYTDSAKSKVERAISIKGMGEELKIRESIFGCPSGELREHLGSLLRRININGQKLDTQSPTFVDDVNKIVTSEKYKGICGEIDLEISKQTPMKDSVSSDAIRDSLDNVIARKFTSEKEVRGGFDLTEVRETLDLTKTRPKLK